MQEKLSEGADNQQEETRGDCGVVDGSLLAALVEFSVPLLFDSL